MNPLSPDLCCRKTKDRGVQVARAGSCLGPFRVCWNGIPYFLLHMLAQTFAAFLVPLGISWISNALVPTKDTFIVEALMIIGLTRAVGKSCYEFYYLHLGQNSARDYGPRLLYRMTIFQPCLVILNTTIALWVISTDLKKKCLCFSTEKHEDNFLGMTCGCKPTPYFAFLRNNYVRTSYEITGMTYNWFQMYYLLQARRETDL